VRLRDADRRARVRARASHALEPLNFNPVQHPGAPPSFTGRAAMAMRPRSSRRPGSAIAHCCNSPRCRGAVQVPPHPTRILGTRSDETVDTSARRTAVASSRLRCRRAALVRGADPVCRWLGGNVVTPNSGKRMSALGHHLTFCNVQWMSALPPKADSPDRGSHRVAALPKKDGGGTPSRWRTREQIR